MLPYLIAGAIGFGIGKLFEEGGETFGRGGMTKNQLISQIKKEMLDYGFDLTDEQISDYIQIKNLQMFETNEREEYLDFIAKNITGMSFPSYGDTNSYKQNFYQKLIKNAKNKGYNFSGETFGRGGITTNEGIIKSFLTSTKEVKVNNLSTHFNEYENLLLLRNYGTIIAGRYVNNNENDYRYGTLNFCYVTKTKYSQTTTKIVNKLKALATKMGYTITDACTFDDGGEIKDWKNAKIGDSARVLSENKMGLIIKDYGRKFHLKFVDGSEKTYDASELEFYRFTDTYAGGGEAGDDLIEYIIPTWAVGSLINVDDTGLTDEEVEKIDRFVDKVVEQWGNALFMLGDDDDSESYFSYSNDIDNMGSEVMKLFILPSNNADDNYAEGGEAGKKGKLNATYIPKRNIKTLTTTYGNTIKGKDLLDGAYTTRKDIRQDPKMVRTIFEEEEFAEFNNGGEAGKKSFADVYDEVVKYIMTDQNVSYDEAVAIIDEENGETFIRDMVESQGNYDAEFIAENILSTDEGKYYAEGGVAKKRRRRANLQTGRTDRSVDKTRVAKPVGYRFTNSLASKLRKDKYEAPTEKQVKKYIGKGIYKENRKNRSDRDRTIKL
jgi:hypothetical protein